MAQKWFYKSQGAHIIVDRRDDNRADHQQPVRKWYVCLVMESLAGVDCLDVWEVRQSHDL